MLIDAYVIAGFLGAGKTTLIQKLMKEAFGGKKVVIIENDFGEISVDAAILRSDSIKVKELSSGCICCSLVGNFVDAVYQVVRTYFPDVILIEPSGVGKLSDVMKACRHPKIQPLLDRVKSITVADVTTLRKYIKNYGEFFIDQLSYADIVWLSHTDELKTPITEITQLIYYYNRTSVVMTYQQGKIPEALLKETKRVVKSPVKGGRPRNIGRHTAKEVFDTCSVFSKNTFDKKTIKECFHCLENGKYGEIIRAKGIVKGEDSYLFVQYIPGKLTLEEVITSGNALCFIGQNLKKQNLMLLFDGGVE